MNDSDTVAAERLDLGRQLAARRKQAGYLQRELAYLMGYSRTAIANAETAATQPSHNFWTDADRVLGTGELFARGHKRIVAQMAAESRKPGERDTPAVERDEPDAGCGLVAPTADRARQAYLDEGWPVEEDPEGRLWLITGTVIDALEVPRPAGIVTMNWWLYTRGVPDEIRALPALPDPAGALAIISVGSRCYFLVRSGAYPWTNRPTSTADPMTSANRAVVRWHADGSRVPAPPSLVDGGEPVEWVHVPSAEKQLASPMALLHVLARAVDATKQDGVLMLPGGTSAVPAVAAPSPDVRQNGTRQ